MDKYKSIKLLSIPTIIFLVILTIFPFIYSLIISFTNYNFLNDSFNFIGIDNYKNLFQDDVFVKSLGNTTYILIIGTIIELLIGVSLGLILSKIIKPFKRITQIICLIPMGLAPVAIALIWKNLFNATNGILNYLLIQVGFSRVDWLGSINYALISVIIVDIWQWTPLVILFTLAGVESISKQSIEMSQTDGASTFQTYIYFILPQIKNFIIVSMLLRLIDTLKIFDIVYVLTEGGPGTATETLSLYGYRQGFIFFNTGYASAESFFILFITTILTISLIKVVGKIE